MITDNIPVTKVVTDLADSIAGTILQLEKKCFSMARAQQQLQENKRVQKRKKIIQEFRKRAEERRDWANQEKERVLQEHTGQEGSRLARINRIKEAMYSRQSEGLETPGFINQAVVYEHFARELRPQILKKYPNAPMDKVNKVIEQKWTTIDPNKKQAYTQKIIRKLQMQPVLSMQEEPQMTPIKQEAREEKSGQQSRLEVYIDSKNHRDQENHLQREEMISEQERQEEGCVKKEAEQPTHQSPPEEVSREEEDE